MYDDDFNMHDDTKLSPKEIGQVIWLSLFFGAHSGIGLWITMGRRMPLPH